MKILLLECQEKAKPLENLSPHNYEIRKLSAYESSRDLLRESAKWCEVLFIGADKSCACVIADEIWHLLRRRLVISLTEGLRIQALRDLYPLSKVSRCYVYPKLQAERAFFLTSLDDSYSSQDSAALKELFGNIGDSLFVREDLMETLQTYLESFQNLISDLVTLLIESLDVNKDRDLYEYLLGWAFYGTGLHLIRGLTPSRPKLQRISPDLREKILCLLKDYYKP
ncbi:MAG: hypothetical protein ACUVQ5_03115 [Candidatus Methanomethylicaceae archaeon]